MSRLSTDTNLNVDNARTNTKLIACEIKMNCIFTNLQHSTIASAELNKQTFDIAFVNEPYVYNQKVKF